MAEIDYCEVSSGAHSWDEIVASSGYCADVFHDEIDDWVTSADTKWFPEGSRWPPSPADSKLELARRFYLEADKWDRETQHLSSPAQIMMHPSYQAVLGMANENENEIVRLMLHDVRDHRRCWFWALSYLTKENPIKPSDAGRLDKMIKSWVEWGRQKGML